MLDNHFTEIESEFKSFHETMEKTRHLLDGDAVRCQKCGRLVVDKCEDCDE